MRDIIFHMWRRVPWKRLVGGGGVVSVVGFKLYSAKPEPAKPFLDPSVAPPIEPPTYYKLTNAESTNRGYRLKEGRNVDPQYDPDPKHECSFGLYVTDWDHLGHWAKSFKFTHVYDASIPDSAHRLLFKEKARASELELSNFRPIAGLFSYESQCVENIDWAYPYLHTDQWTEAVALAHIERKGSLKIVPEEKRTKRVCLEAMKKNGWDIRLVPKRVLTQEMCAQALESTDFGMIGLVPSRFLSLELLSKGLDVNPASVLPYFPLSQLDENKCRDIVEKHPMDANAVPSRFQTRFLWLLSIQAYPFMMKYVPDQFISPSFINKAVNVNVNCYQYLPDDSKTQALSERAVEINPLLFEHVPDHHKTQAMSERVIEINPELFKHVLDNHKTQALWERVVEHTPSQFKDIPDKFKTASMCERVIKVYNGLYAKYIRYVPDEFKTQAMCDYVVHRDYRLYEDIPIQFQTMELQTHYNKWREINL